MPLYYRGKEISEHYQSLYEYMDYLEERMKYAHKVWIEQDMRDKLEGIYEYLDLLLKQNKLEK